MFKKKVDPHDRRGRRHGCRRVRGSVLRRNTSSQKHVPVTPARTVGGLAVLIRPRNNSTVADRRRGSIVLLPGSRCTRTFRVAHTVPRPTPPSQSRLHSHTRANVLFLLKNFTQRTPKTKKIRKGFSYVCLVSVLNPDISGCDSKTTFSLPSSQPPFYVAKTTVIQVTTDRCQCRDHLESRLHPPHHNWSAHTKATHYTLGSRATLRQEGGREGDGSTTLPGTVSRVLGKCVVPVFEKLRLSGRPPHLPHAGSGFLAGGEVLVGTDDHSSHPPNNRGRHRPRHGPDMCNTRNDPPSVVHKSSRTRSGDRPGPNKGRNTRG